MSSDCTCGAAGDDHHSSCPAYLEDDAGPLLLEDILNAKSALYFFVGLTIVALLAFVAAGPLDIV